MGFFKGIPPQITRLTLVAVVIVALFLAARYVLTPKSFGKFGHYRADSIADVEALPVKYAGNNEPCGMCHPEIVKTLSSSPHKGLICETCHGPALAHAEDPSSSKPIKPRGRDFCTVCHSKDAARPKNFPQVDVNTHNAGMDCNLCHKGHEPLKGLK